jgi:hypothetical protein
VSTADIFDVHSPEAWDNFLRDARQTCPLSQLSHDFGYVIATYDEICAAAVNPRQFSSVRKIFGAGDPELEAIAAQGFPEVVTLTGARHAVPSVDGEAAVRLCSKTDVSQPRESGKEP